MSAPVDFTGERFLPECTGEIWAEHWHRYMFAASFVAGKHVLDAASGEGYGSAWLARHARAVVGLDLDAPTVEAARAKYRSPGLEFVPGSVSAIPFADARFDCVVSFETLEHLAEQDEMLSEFRRVLRPDGLLIISTPNRVEYSEKRDFSNEFHVRELDEDEFRSMLARYFPAQRWFGQKLLFNSAVWPLPARSDVKGEWIALDESPSRLPDPMYFVALAAASASSIPDHGRMTLLADPGESMYHEYERTVARVETLEQLTRQREALILERDQIVETRDEHIRHLEALTIARERIVEERDRQLAAQTAEGKRLISQYDVTLRERERIIAERDGQLAQTNQRATTLERLLTDRERIVVDRDAHLAALNQRVERLERLIVQRDSELAAVNARTAEAGRLLTHREHVVVERDRQLDAANQRAVTLEILVAERERIIVERDAQLQAANELRAQVESAVAERVAQLDAAAGRAAEMERVIGVRDKQVLDQQEQLARAAESIAALESDARSLRDEILRRGGWRWWLKLPLRRIFGTRAAPQPTGRSGP